MSSARASQKQLVYPCNIPTMNITTAHYRKYRGLIISCQTSSLPPYLLTVLYPGHNEYRIVGANDYH